MNKSILCGLAAAALWGTSNVLAKSLLSRFEPGTLLLVELIASGLVLWTVLFCQRRKDLFTPEALRASLTGLLQPGLAYVFAIYGLSMTTADSEAIIWTTETIAVIFLVWLLFRERIGWFIFILAIVGTAGAMLATGSNFGSTLTPSMILGNWFVVGAVIVAASYTILSQRQLVKIEPLHLFALHQLAALSAAVIIWLLCLPILQPFNRGTTYLDYLGAAVCGAVGQFALPFWCYLMAIKGIGAARTAIFLVLPPVFTIIGSFFFLGEKLTLLQLIGAALAVVAVGAICTLRPEEATAEIVSGAE